VLSAFAFKTLEASPMLRVNALKSVFGMALLQRWGEAFLVRPFARTHCQTCLLGARQAGARPACSCEHEGRRCSAKNLAVCLKPGTNASDL